MFLHLSNSSSIHKGEGNACLCVRRMYTKPPPTHQIDSPNQADIPRQADTPPCRADTPYCHADTFPLSGRPHGRQGTANKAGGTHPTGIYSYLYVLVQLYERLLSNLSHVCTTNNTYGFSTENTTVKSFWNFLSGLAFNTKDQLETESVGYTFGNAFDKVLESSIFFIQLINI